MTWRESGSIKITIAPCKRTWQPQVFLIRCLVNVSKLQVLLALFLGGAWNPDSVELGSNEPKSNGTLTLSDASFSILTVSLDSKYWLHQILAVV